MTTQKTLWNPFSSKNTKELKLVTFKVPNHICNDFDELVRFKRGSRTSYLVSLMDTFIRNEMKRLEESNRINEFISDLKIRNKTTDTLHRRKDTFRRHKNDYETDHYDPPMVPSLDDDFDWEERFKI